MDDLRLIKERFSELSERAVNKNFPVSTYFLNLFEQNILEELRLYSAYKMFGGTEYSERKMCVFYPENYDENNIFPQAEFVSIYPKNEKFAKAQTHRDFLGAILNLGIDRKMIGDIYLTNDGKSAFVYVHNKMTEYICSNLNRVGNNVVYAVKGEYEEILDIKFDIKSLTLVSKRADLTVADVFNISRSKSKELFSDEKIFINGRLCIRAEKELEKDDVVSVRGFGKFKIKGYIGISKKGKIKLEIAKFI